MSGGSRFLELAEMKLESNESPEELFQRLREFFEENLVTKHSRLTHHSENIDEDELSPSLENTIVLLWLKLIHQDLPQLVKQRFGDELQTKTLASIKIDISQNLDSLLDELHTNIDRGHIIRYSNINTNNHNNGAPTNPPPSAAKIHTQRTDASLKRVLMKPSPTMQFYYNNEPITLTLDTGTETNLIKEQTAHRLGVNITPTTQYATQADGATQLIITGETKLTVTKDAREFILNAFVARNIDADVLAGIPFMSCNDIAIRPAKKEVMLSDGTTYCYGTSHVIGISISTEVRRT